MARTKNTKRYALIDIRAMTSVLNGGTFYRLTWVCLDDDPLSRWEMDVQDTYRNYLKNGWRTIVQARQWGIYTGMQETRKSTNLGVGVLSADSQPVREIPIDLQATAIEVVLHANELQQSLQARTQFDNLFAPAY